MLSIREMRDKTGLSQSKFAAYVKIPVVNIQHWEQGVSQPPPYVVEMIERVLRLEGKI